MPQKGQHVIIRHDTPHRQDRLSGETLSSSPLPSAAINSFAKASNLVVFVLCIISIIARFYVRIRVQRQFSIDDGTLLFGFACLITSIVLLFINVDRLYIIGSIYTGATDLQIPSDIKQQAAEFNKLILAEAVLTWCSIVSVKFSYLFLFKRLINRIRPLVKYWWFTVVVNIMISVYVPITYVFACDPYNDTIIGEFFLSPTVHPPFERMLTMLFSNM